MRCTKVSASSSHPALMCTWPLTHLASELVADEARDEDGCGLVHKPSFGHHAIQSHGRHFVATRDKTAEKLCCGERHKVL
jgi:hypothetical protein